MTLNRLWLLPPLLALAACDKEKEVDPPAELVKFQPKLDIDQVWKTGLGGGTKALRLGLRPVVDGDRLFVADHEGEVLAVQIKDGRIQWRTRTKLPLSGGPGVGAGLVVVGSVDGDVVALNAADGAELWRVQVRGEVLSAPAVAEQAVVVRSVDGRLRGLDTKDGKELWMIEQAVPRLSLRGTAAPVIVGDIVICGFDNGKVLAVGLTAGEIVWETAVAPARGRTELDRLVDIDSRTHVIDKDVFVVGFQGKAAMLALESGQIWWARDASSDRGLAVGDESVYISAANGDVIALRRRDGTPEWEQAALHRRSLSGPALDGGTIVVADFQGYVHWLDAASGELLARRGTDGDRVTNAPVVANGLIVVLTDSGTLTAFRRVEKASAQAG
jgi:outer membrane protein assembly factor BamB